MNWLRSAAKQIRNDWSVQALIIGVLAYTITWSYLSIARFFALHATVYDLGAEIEQLYGYAHYSFVWGVRGIGPFVLPGQVLLSPLSLSGSYPLALFVQTLALGSGAIAVYGVGREVLKSRWVSISLAFAYLVYPPLAGVNWFDFHAQAFFTPLFLFAYLALLRRSFIIAFILFVIAAGVYYPYVVLVALFALLTLIELAITKIRYPTHDPGARQLWQFHLLLLLVTACMFAGQWALYSSVGISTTTAAVVIGGPVPVSNRVIVLLLFLAPVLFLPVFSPKWLAMLLPFLYLEFSSSFWAFSYPAILHLQYPTIAISAIFLGAIYGLKRLKQGLASPSRNPSRRPLRASWRLPSFEKPGYIATAILVASISFAAVYQPYGPLNPDSGSNFDVPESVSINWTLYDGLNHLVELIPSNQPDVLYQNDMPEMLPRPTYAPSAPPLVAPYPFVNASLWDVDMNMFPVNPHPVDSNYIPLFYAIGNPNSIWYDIGGNTSAAAFLQVMYSSGAYGMVGEVAGMTVLQRSYDGSLKYYSPWFLSYPATELYSAQTERLSTQGTISSTDPKGVNVWYGPYANLPPGRYTVSFRVMATDVASTDHVTLGVTTGAGTPTSPLQLLSTRVLLGSNFTEANEWTTFVLTVNLVGYLGNIQFVGYNAWWNGTLSIQNVDIDQYAPF